MFDQTEEALHVNDDSSRRSVADLLDLIGTWISVVGTIVSAIALTVEFSENNNSRPLSGRFLVDVRPAPQQRAGLPEEHEPDA